MTETQERFLRTVLSRVPLDRVVELHLFPPIRRGTLETGVAVIATVLPPASVALVADGGEAEDAVGGVDEKLEDAEHIAADVDTGDATAIVELADAIDAEPDAVVEMNDAVDAAEAAASRDDVAADDQSVDDDSPYRDEGAEAVNPELPGDVAELAGEPAVPVVATAPRMRILTAAYRHTIKGLDRGKWSVDVQEEADAPLDAVEAVLRGVRHRSTEPADPEQVSLEALGALLAPSQAAPAAA
jgi:hypothetical protein